MNTLLKILLIITTLTLLVVTYLHPIAAITQDLGRHIKTGEIIWTTHSIPPTNLYSYTYPNFPFSNHHWGPEVFFYLVYQATGFPGTLFLTFSLSVSAFLIIYWYALKKASLIAVSFVSFLSLGILLERTDVRPEAFSFFFLSLFLIILFKNREKPTKWLTALIPLQLLWVNTHVYFIIGIVLVGLFFLDSLFIHFRHSKKTLSLHLTPLPGLLLFVLVSCCLASLFNPNGLSGALYPFRVFDNYGYAIEENQNIFLLWEFAQKRTIVFFWTTVVLFFITLLLRARHTRPIDWFLAIIFTIIGIQAIRNFPLFVFTMFIPFTYHLSSLLHPLQKNAKFFLSVSICCVVLLFWQLFYVPTVKPMELSTPIGASKAVDFMIAQNIKGPIFNNFDIGSYLIFRLYPREKVFVDGRPEAYPASFFQNTYIPMQQDPKLFKKLDKKYHFNTIFFAHTDQTPWAKQFLQAIVKNSAWKVLYLDDTVIVLSKDTTVKPISLIKYTIPSSASIPSLYNLFIFFETVQLPEKQTEVLQQIIQKDPTDCTALGILSQTQTQTALIYQSRYMATCQ